MQIETDNLKIVLSKPEELALIALLNKRSLPDALKVLRAKINAEPQKLKWGDVKMNGWKYEINFYSGRPHWMRKVGEWQLYVWMNVKNLFSARSERGMEVISTYKDNTCTDFDSPQDAAMALLQQERERAQKILDELKDPE